MWTMAFAVEICLRIWVEGDLHAFMTHPSALLDMLVVLLNITTLGSGWDTLGYERVPQEEHCCANIDMFLASFRFHHALSS